MVPVVFDVGFGFYIVVRIGGLGGRVVRGFHIVFRVVFVCCDREGMISGVLGGSVCCDRGGLFRGRRRGGTTRDAVVEVEYAGYSFDVFVNLEDGLVVKLLLNCER